MHTLESSRFKFLQEGSSMLHSQMELEHLLVRVHSNWGWNWGYNTHLCRWVVKLSTIFICYASCADDIELVQMRSETQYIIRDPGANSSQSFKQIHTKHFRQTGSVQQLETYTQVHRQRNSISCANERWNTQYNVHYLLCNLYKWGVEHSTVPFVSNLCRWCQAYANEGWSTINICYAICAIDVKLVQMRGGPQYKIHLLCSPCW